MYDIVTLVYQSVVYGMLFAFGYHVLKRYRIIQDNENKNLFSTAINWTLAGLGLIGIAVSSDHSPSSLYPKIRQLIQESLDGRVVDLLVKCCVS